ncbi:MAG: serine/threonine-protein kinase [Verrucomicrobiae bacterium]
MLANESSQNPESQNQPEPGPAADGGTENIYEACPACQTLMDMSDVMPFTEVACPGCGITLRARKQFNHFTLIEKVGEGGMGSVYKALDNNLNRHVALKILKKEISANQEERAKLAREAEITASVNHPNVVKVYHFGRDHGQFYLAMELVEKGSLDDLMAIQKRVAEAQVLEVGIQIAMGLAAALELGLIHRDIKPGNILFKDAHTAKLVDFGLAIVMDEEASGRGEIWGTPYYIAPEKLDSQPEDFRSDMYSLGGTLFHALAGRPPYEADSPSMVALKQLKSQPISLQAFAPDVSSETAYVINRMMAKKPEERYQSYEELIGHLTYAREKLLERARKPIQPKQRVVMETEETRKVSAIVSLVLLLVVVLGGAAVYLMRDRLFPAAAAESGPRKISAQDAKSLFLSGVSTLAGGDYEGAKTEFKQIAPGLPQPEKNWAHLNFTLACFLLGETQPAFDLLKQIQKEGLYSKNPEDSALANFFPEVSRTLLEKKMVPASLSSLYDSKQETFALLLFGIWDWEQKAAFSDAALLLESFCERADKGMWEASYKPLAEKYLADWLFLEPVENGAKNISSPDAATALLKDLRKARSQTQTGNRVNERMDALEKELRAKGAKP